MTQLQIEKQIQLYKLALILLASATAITIAGFIQVLAMQASNADLSFSNALAGNGLFSPLGTLIADAFAAPGMIWLYRSSKKLATLSPDEASKKYRGMWAFQQVVGTIVTIGAVIMIPGSLMAIQMLLPGFAVVFPIFAGAYIHLKARKLNREIRLGISDEAPKPKSAPVEVSNGEASADQPTISETPVVEGSAGMVPLVVTGVLLGINVITEISFFNDFRNQPDFATAGSSMYPSSLMLVLAQMLDIFVVNLIAIVFGIIAWRGRSLMVKGRLRLIAIFTIANLAIFPGAIATPLALATGPSAKAAELKVQQQESLETLTQLRSLDLPAGFEMIDEFYSCLDAGCGEEVNSQWRTGIYKLDEPAMVETCKAVIDYAINFGLDTYQAGAGSEPKTIGDGTTAATECAELMGQYPVLKVQKYEVLSPTFTISGTANFGAESPLKLELSLMKAGEQSEKPNSWGYEFKISTSYNSDPYQTDGGLSQGTVELNALLEAFGQARLAEPDRNPTDPTFVKEVLAGYKYPIEIEIVETKPGVANRLDLTNSDGDHMCLSIDKWVEEEMGSPDPGTGYAIGGMENLDVLSGFGNAVGGGC